MSNRKPRTGRNIRARRQIEAWIRSLLSDEFHLHPDRIDPTTQLRHWGYGDEKSVALLAAKFNQVSRNRPEWHNVHVTPPELVSAVHGKRLGELVDFLSDKLERATADTITTPPQPPPSNTLYQQIKKLVIQFMRASLHTGGKIDLNGKYSLIFGSPDSMQALVDWFNDDAPGWHVDPAQSRSLCFRHGERPEEQNRQRRNQ